MVGPDASQEPAGEGEGGHVYDDEDLDVDERQSLISFRGMRRTPSSHGKTFKAILHHIDSQFFYLAPFDPFL